MKNKKPVTITLTEKEVEKVKTKSTEVLGRPNISGYIAYLINKDK